MADTGTTQGIQVIVGGKGHVFGTCDTCPKDDENQDAPPCNVYHIGYTQGKVGSDVWMCEDCIQDHKHLVHYDYTGFTPEFVAKTKKSTQAEEKPMTSTKKGTTNTGKSKKATEAVQPSAPVATMLSAVFAGDGSSPNYRRFKLQQKGAELAGSVYITPDLVPEGCTDIVVTVTYKEN